MANELKDILDTITADGSSGYKAEKGRYHLYVSKSCPFAARPVIGRLIKGLEDVITMDIVDPVKETYWEFSPEKDGCTADTVNGKKDMKEIYKMSHPNYTGKISVPVLFDKQTKKIVNNSSAAILRMFATQFNEFCATKEQAALDLYPEEKRKEIDDLIKEISSDVAGAVYGIGFAQTQKDYDEKVEKLFTALDKLEDTVSKKRFLTGSKLTEADVFLFTPLVRFDAVYGPLFKCNKKMLIQYPNLWAYARDIYQTRNIGSTVDMRHIVSSYYTSFKNSNPSGIIPVGPNIDFTRESGRSTMA